MRAAAVPIVHIKRCIKEPSLAQGGERGKRFLRGKDCRESAPVLRAMSEGAQVMWSGDFFPRAARRNRGWFFRHGSKQGNKNAKNPGH